MIEISQKNQEILSFFLAHNTLSSSDVHARLTEQGAKPSLVTVKRALSKLVKLGYIVVRGGGRSITYEMSSLGRISLDIDAQRYCAEEPDQRVGLTRFNFDLLPALPPDIFTLNERNTLERATETYRQRTADLPPAIEKKELERLIIELSWKSSKIEGNTYTLLDTERLILEQREAPGHDHHEAQMILNHKDAFTFVREHAQEFRTMTRAHLEHVHGILVKDLNVGSGFRQKPVGVVGSKYQPLDNIHQIKEATDTLIAAVTRMETPYGKALVALLGLSYIQPFEDGNKRTARLIANALLLAYRCAPLSYRSVDEKDYREATLVWYEVNSLVPLKRIFVEQYAFAATHYLVK